ncbi:MAG: hypothetical protein QM597_06645 [Aeromicrobium sp.]|uniref:hypothetical protein n=1 Tax=Aeromicrobium sp. TaxID=1871063 RepID=UPI0039E5244E
MPDPSLHPPQSDCISADRPRYVLAWWSASSLAALAVIAQRLIVNRQYFFWDDSQVASFGQWYDLGRRLHEGTWTILDPGSWQGGNFLAEQQWGLWSPLAWVIGLGSHVQDNPVIYATFVKVAFLLLLQTAAFGLARSYGSSAPWAALAGVTAAVGGQTLYIDAPSWVPNLQGIALFALTWWMLRRHLDAGRGPGAYFAAAFLLVTLGYAFAVIAALFLFSALLAESWWLERDHARARRIVGLGVYLGLLVVFVYLPGILTASVTDHAGLSVTNDQFLNLDLGDLAASTGATSLSSVAGWWGPIAPAPIHYIAWFLPLFALLGPGLRRHGRPLLVVGVVAALSMAMVLGPSSVGPLLYPSRMLPYVGLCLAVAFAVIATKAWPTSVPWRRQALVVAIALAGLWTAWTAQPDNLRWLAVGGAAQIAALVGVMSVGARITKPRIAPWAAGFSVLATVMLLGLQLGVCHAPPLAYFRVPNSVEAIGQVQAGSDEGVMTVGDIYAIQGQPEAWREVLIGNVWRVRQMDSASAYTVLPHRVLAQRLCLDLRGVSCPQAYERLFEVQPDGSRLVDDLHLNTIIVARSAATEQSAAATEPVLRDGWSMTQGKYTWTVHRDDPVEPAGGITRTSGVTVSDVTVRDTRVSFTVEEVEGSAGTVVFSRIAWPGYRVEGAEQAAASEDFLLTVTLTPDDVGKEVVVSFRPPGWPVELASAVLAMMLAVAWTATHAITSR